MSDHNGHTVELEEPGTLNDVAGSLTNSAMIVGAVGLGVAGLVAITTDSWDRFFFSYLHNFCFVLSITLGAMFFVLIQHLTRAGWSAVVRRLAEIMTTGFTPVAVLFLPILLLVLAGDDILYLWNNAEVAATDPLIKHKVIYLNSTWFAIRAVIYFGFWILCCRFYMAVSTKQDETGDPALTLKMEWYSPVSMILFALTLSFASIDWIMSLDPRWFSTIIGVYFFANCVVAFFSALTIFISLLNSKGVLTKSINTEHRHDIGKLLFGFNCFWAYIAFSQYMLYWYANIPEETVWFARRQENGWEVVSMILILGHFVIPFVGLMSRHVKRNSKQLLFWACFLLTMCWIDLYWLIMPEVSPQSAALGFIDLACLFGISGLFVFGILKVAGQQWLIAKRDPRMPESLSFQNI